LCANKLGLPIRGSEICKTTLRIESCVIDSDSSRVTIVLNLNRVESESPKIVTRVESGSPKIVTRVKSRTRVRLSLQAA